MASFTDLFTLTSPIFLLIGLGFLCVRIGWLAKDKTQGLSWFVVNIGLPAAIFTALSSRSLNEILHLDYLFVYGLGSLAAFFTLFSIARFRQRGITEAAFFGLGASASNSLLIGFPIVVQLFGDAALVPFALTLMVENLLILPLTLALADSGQKKGLPFALALLRAFPGLFKNPIFLSILAGMLCAAFNVQIPLVAGKALDMLATTVGAIALFSIGAMLVGLKTGGMITNISFIVAGKLLLHPMLVIALTFVFTDLPPLYQSIAVVMACMPMFSVYALLGARYGLGGLCSAALLPATLLSFVTINVFLFFWLAP